MSKIYLRFAVVAGLGFFLSGCAFVGGATEPKLPASGIIASAHPLATQEGLAVLADGGNAFDAAVTVAAVLAVVEPFGSGLGGGGFWLLHDQSKDQSVFVDGRETAPFNAAEDMYLNAEGEVERDLAINHPLAAAIPGTPAAMVHIQAKYGRLPLSRLLEPAIRHAREGFAVTAEYQDALEMRLSALQRWPSAARIFLDENKEIPPVGWRLVQLDLAQTLQAMSDNGRNGFYGGAVARQLVDEVQRGEGIWSLKDLQGYEVVEREPIKFNYGDYTITSAPLPSSGGLVLGSVFGQLSELGYEDRSEADRLHLWLEANRNAYYQRAMRMGDSDFTRDEGLDLLEVDHIQTMAARVSLGEAGVSADLGKVDSGVRGDQTTHFSVLDNEGNRAAVTLSINLYFGSGFVAEGTGVLLNNEMDDFSAKPGSPNAYGLVGSHANRIEPGKRPLSSMSPTYVEGKGQVWVLGTPGGSRIITMVGRGALAAMTGATPQDVVGLGRVHHQYLPDKVFVERDGLKDSIVNTLKQRGHTVVQMDRQYGDMQVVRWNTVTGQVDGASDPRGEGLAGTRNEMVE